jgi:hypothetical protein
MLLSLRHSTGVGRAGHGIIDRMTETLTPHTDQIQRNGKGQFVQGSTGNRGGRPVGSRSKLASDFVADLHEAWQQYGVDALKATAQTDPAKFCQIVANVLPRDIQIDVDVTLRQAQSALEAYRMLKSLPRKELEQLENASLDTVG